MKKVYVLDTNIILTDAKLLYKISNQNENLIVIPETVLDELDNKKSGHDEINYQARSFARLLENYATITSKTEKDGCNIVSMRISNGQDIDIVIVSKSKYENISDSTLPKIINDRKILEVAEYARDVLYKESKVIFLSLDIMCRIRAISLGLEVETIKGSKDDFSFEFLKELDTILSIEELSSGIDINIIDSEYKPENYSYILNLADGRKAIGYVTKNNTFNLIDEEELARQEVNPRNIEQKLLSSAILNKDINIIVSNSLAGSGKTLVAISTAMKLVDDRTNTYNKIVYIRNSIESVEKNEEIGFLSGNEEKLRIYNEPLYDTLRFIASKQIDASNSNKGKASRVAATAELIESKSMALIEKYSIQTIWPGELRGRTISNAVVIVDEFQNCSNKTASTIISRLDEQCKLIALGSLKQIDNAYLNKYITGLSTLLIASKSVHEEVNMFAIEMKKVLRGRITEFSERIFGDVQSGK
jgi:PhoH-like ATPase